MSLNLSRERDLTVAHVSDRPGVGLVEVTFRETDRSFCLFRSREHFNQLLSTLRASEVSMQPVRVTFTTPRGKDIEDVRSV
jgi:hypothetical protein